MSEKIYAKGIYGKKPRQGAPSFVLGSLSFKIEEFIPFLQNNNNGKGYVNIDLLAGKDERINAVLNTFKPVGSKATPPSETAVELNESFKDDDLPF